MNNITIQLHHTTQDQYRFAATDEQGHSVDIDASTSGKEPSLGTRPMRMVLMSLGSCSGIDIITILHKQKLHISHFTIKIEGLCTQDIPSLWKDIHVTFELSGDIDYSIAWRACNLSIEKYCSVAETLRRAGALIKWNLTVNGKSPLSLRNISDQLSA